MFCTELFVYLNTSSPSKILNKTRDSNKTISNPRNLTFSHDILFPFKYRSRSGNSDAKKLTMTSILYQCLTLIINPMWITENKNTAQINKRTKNHLSFLLSRLITSIVSYAQEGNDRQHHVLVCFYTVLNILTRFMAHEYTAQNRDRD